MGCACDKERDPEKHSESQNMPPSMTLLPLCLCPEEPQRPRRGSQPLTAAIKELTQPVETMYRLGRKIAEGKMGTLLEAEYLGSQKPCFIRVIQRLKGRALLLQQIKLSSEADKLLSFDHPHILRTYEVMEDDKNFYIVTEAFTGGLLQDHYQDTAYNSEEGVADLVYQLLGALSYCAKRGIIHGRLSMQTLVLSEAGGVTSLKLTGFGHYDSVLPDTKDELKEVNFKPPESEGGYNEKSDVWSCGAIAHFLLFGFPPSSELLSGPANTPSHLSSLQRSYRRCVNKSPQVLEFLSYLLGPIPALRLPPGQGRCHSWVGMHRKRTTIKPTALLPYLYNMRKVNRRNPLQNAVLRFFLTHVMSDSELAFLAQPFSELDRDGDGTLGDAELLHGFLRILPEKEAMQAVKRVLRAADYNSNGAVTFSEFVITALGEKRLLSSANVDIAFKCFDRDCNGSISMNELKGFFYVKDFSEKERQWRAIMLQANRSGGDEIDYSEFIALMANINPA